MEDAHRRKTELVTQTNVGCGHMAEVFGNHRTWTQFAFDSREVSCPAMSPSDPRARSQHAREWTGAREAEGNDRCAPHRRVQFIARTAAPTTRSESLVGARAYCGWPQHCPLRLNRSAGNPTPSAAGPFGRAETTADGSIHPRCHALRRWASRQSNHAAPMRVFAQCPPLPVELELHEVLARNFVAKSFAGRAQSRWLAPPHTAFPLGPRFAGGIST